MGVDHRGPYIAVSQQPLYRADIIIGLQKVSDKAVAEGIIERIKIFCYSAVAS